MTLITPEYLYANDFAIDSYPPVLNSEYFKFTSSVHSYSTRQLCNRNLYVAPVNTTQYGLRFLNFVGPRLWNSLSTSITNSISHMRRRYSALLTTCRFNLVPRASFPLTSGRKTRAVRANLVPRAHVSFRQ